MFDLPIRTSKAISLTALLALGLAGCGGGMTSTSLPTLGSSPASSAGSVRAGSAASLGAIKQTSAPNAYASAVLANAPLAYYQLGDSTATLVDSGPNTFNGGYGSTVTRKTQAITQGAGYASAFPGGTAYDPNGFASTAQNAILQPAKITVEAWIKFSAATAAKTYVPIVVYGKQGTSYGLYLQGLGGNADCLFYQQTNAGVSSRLLLHGLTHLSAGIPYHVVATFNGSTVTTYVNGLLDQTASFPGAIGYGTTLPVGLQIGGQLSNAPPTGDASFPGTIGQVAIYGTSMTQSMVIGHYLAGQPLPMISESATPADTLVNSIGINTHFSDSSGIYALQFSQVQNLLAATGIRHFRDNVSFSPTFVSMVKQLAALNMFGDYVTQPTLTQAQVQSYPALVSPSLEIYEAPNEPDDQAGQTAWQQPCITFQQTLYNWIKGYAGTASYPVIGPGLAYAANYGQLGNISENLDYGNLHDYMGAYNPGFAGGPYGGIKAMLGYAQLASGTKPVISTETGYGTTTGSPAIDYAADLRYETRMFFEQFKAGFSRSYAYEFIDENRVNGGFATYGLLTSNLTPKPAYTGIQSLIAALKDPGVPFNAASLSYNLSGLSTVHHLLLQKRNGSFVLALWQEVPSWNVTSGGDISVASQNVTVTTANKFSSATVATMNESGNLSTAVLPLSNQQATVTVTDKISLLTLTP